MATKFLRIGFYRVTVNSDPPIRFDRILRKFENEIADDESRTVDSRNDQPIRLQALHHAHSFWTGDMVRIRLNEDLTRVNRRGRRRRIDFENDEGLGENTAFLYHPRSQTIAIHESRGAVPVSAFPKYFALLGEVDGIDFRPIMKPEALARIARMGALHKFEIAVAPLQNARGLADQGEGANALMNIARYFNSPKLKVIVESPRRFGAEGLHGVIDTLEGFLGPRGDARMVTKAVVIGSSPDDERTDDLVNVLQDRLVEEVGIELPAGQRVADPQRHAAVRTAWETHSAAIEQYYTRVDADDAAPGV